MQARPVIKFENELTVNTTQLKKSEPRMLAGRNADQASNSGQQVLFDFIQPLVSGLNSGATVLDYGNNDGSDLLSVARMIPGECHLLSIDDNYLNRKKVDSFNSVFTKGKLFKAYPAHRPDWIIETETVDLLIVRHCFQSLKKSFWDLREIVRVAKKGAWLVFYENVKLPASCNNDYSQNNHVKTGLAAAEYESGLYEKIKHAGLDLTNRIQRFYTDKVPDRPAESFNSRSIAIVARKN